MNEATPPPAGPAGERPSRAARAPQRSRAKSGSLAPGQLPPELAAWVLETGRVYEQMCQRQLAQLHALRRELAPYLPPAEVQQALREAAVPCYLLSLYDGLELLAGPAGVMAVAASARQLASITPENPQGNRQDPLELWHELDPLCPLPRLTAGTPG